MCFATRRCGPQRLRRLLGLYAARGLQIYINFVAQVHEEHTGIFHPPVHVGNDELCTRPQLVAAAMDLGLQSQFVTDAMDRESAMQRDLRVAFGSEAAVEMVWRKDKLGKLVAFQNGLA